MGAPPPAGLSSGSGLGLGVSLAVHGVAFASIVLALRQPWSEPLEGTPQMVRAQMEAFDRTLFDEPVEAPAFIMPPEVHSIPKLEPLPPEELQPLLGWHPDPFAETDKLAWDQIPPDLNPERILQDPELPRREPAAPEPQRSAQADRSVEEDVTPEPAPETAAPKEASSKPRAPAVVSPQAVPSDCPPPVYPRLAQRRGWTGTVVLLVDVAADGSVTGVSIESSSGHDILDKAALTAVRGWRFRPGTLGGRTAALTVRKPIRFGT